MALHPDILQARKPKGGLCACLQSESDEPSSHQTPTTGPGHLPLFADIDSLKAYPSLLHDLIHKSHLVAKVEYSRLQLPLGYISLMLRGIPLTSPFMIVLKY